MQISLSRCWEGSEILLTMIIQMFSLAFVNVIQPKWNIEPLAVLLMCCSYIQQPLAQDIWKYMLLYLTNLSPGFHLKVAIYSKKFRRADTHTHTHTLEWEITYIVIYVLHITLYLIIYIINKPMYTLLYDNISLVK